MERSRLVAAELVVREVGHIDPAEALEPTALVALRDRERGGRYAVRWLQRWLDETEVATIDEAVMVAACLAALGGCRHRDALQSLRALIGRG